MSIHRIYVFGEDCEITLERSSKTRWRAFGTCRGKFYEQVAPSQTRALKGWQYQAELANEFGG